MKTNEQLNQILSDACCLYQSHEISLALDSMAEAITKDYADRQPLFLCVVIGGFVPLTMLLARLKFPLQVDYIHATRYENTMQGSDITWHAYPNTSLKDRDVIIFDDILDGGITLGAVKAYCEAQGAQSVSTAVLIDKPEGRSPTGIPFADYVGLNVPKRYIFGCGMDYQGYFRNLPDIYAVSDDD